jgi:hypothetical protein
MLMSTATKDTDRLAAAHQALSDAIANVVTSEDWQQLLRISQSFHRYSPNNQLLLAAQGAEGLVASFNTWKQIPAVDGSVCRVRKGETAMRVYAPIRTTRREVDQETGDEIVERSVVRFKLVPVFHQGQLVAPPDIPVQPKLLVGDEPPTYLWEAVATQIDAAGFRLERNALDGPGGANGVTSYLDKRVVVRDDLSPVQALKTQIHELAHVMLHAPENRPDGMSRDLVEVEAESVAFVVCDMLGLDSASYSIPYVANWAGGDLDRVRSAAERVLGAARQIVAELETELGIVLLQDPLASARRQLADDGIDEHRALVGAGRSTDDLVADHLAAGRLDWQQLASSIPAIERHRADAVAHDPVGQAVVLAEAGASATATAHVLRAHGLADTEVDRILTTPVLDMLGESPTLYPRDAIRAPLAEPTPIRPLAESLVADLIVAAGRHPAAARHLAESSGQPANVVSLVEERLRRARHPVITGETTSTRQDRALALIDEWSATPTPARPPAIAADAAEQPDPPMPPAA